MTKIGNTTKSVKKIKQNLLSVSDHHGELIVDAEERLDLISCLCSYCCERWYVKSKMCFVSRFFETLQPGLEGNTISAIISFIVSLRSDINKSV